MRDLQPQLLADTWVSASWDEYIQTINHPAYEKARGYYHNGQLRIEMTPLGYDHSYDNTIITVAVNLFGILKAIPLNGLINCSYQKVGTQGCQPDVSYYIGDRVQVIPRGTTIVDLDLYPPPNLVIEIANTSLKDDLDRKKQLYEELKVLEYWVVDVQNSHLRAFALNEGNSREITQSQVLSGLTMSLLEEALRRSLRLDQTQVGTWLLQQMQSQ